MELVHDRSTRTESQPYFPLTRASLRGSGSFGSNTALPFLRDKAKVQRGEQVLVVGASGAVGSAAVQIARHLGAVVTGVTSTSNIDLVASLGASRVIDYKYVDFATRGDTWDIIVDTKGTASFTRCGARYGRAADLWRCRQVCRRRWGSESRQGHIYQETVRGLNRQQNVVENMNSRAGSRGSAVLYRWPHRLVAEAVSPILVSLRARELLDRYVDGQDAFSNAP